jgi:HlyD family secretion protein
MRLLVLFVLCFALACNRLGAKTPAASTTAASEPTTLKTAVVDKRTIRWTVDQPGLIEAFEQTPLVAKIPGYVGKMLHDIGDVVKKGKVLAELSAPELEDEVLAEEAHVSQATVEIELAKKNQIVAEASLRASQTMVQEMVAGEKRAQANFDRWKSESARVNNLVKTNVIDKQTAEETVNQYISAESAMDEAKARIESSRAHERESQAKLEKSAAEVTVAKAKLTAAKADLGRVQSMLRYAKIVAPYDGVITGRFVHTGHFLQPSTSEAKPLFTIARIDPVRIFVEIPEHAVGRILVDDAKAGTKGSTVSIRIPGLSSQEFKKTVQRTSWALRSDARTLRIEVDLENPEGKIRPGMYALASLQLENAGVWTVPLSSIATMDEVTYLFLVEDTRAVKYQVQLGQRDSEFVEVIRKKRATPQANWEAFSGGEKLIVSPPGSLVDGQALK